MHMKKTQSEDIQSAAANRSQGTSRLLLEAGLCLALQQAQLDASGLPSGGVLTSASAMGPFLIDRLRKAGMTFEVKEVVRPE
jgi:short subunit dehydrogenase-like uncharacterized protein